MSADIVSQYLELFGQEALNSGANSEQIEGLQAEFRPHVLPSELLDLYARTNGVNAEVALGISTFLDVETVLANFHFLQTEFTETGIVWRKSLMPIGDNDGAYLLIDLDRLGRNEPNVFFWDMAAGDNSMSLESDSFESLLEMNVSARALAATSKKSLVDAFEEVQRRLCPDKYDVTQQSDRAPSGLVNLVEIF